MKNAKRLTALLLILALTLALAGCGFMSAMARAARKMEKLHSYRMDMDMEMDLRMTILNQSMDMDMLVSSVSDVEVEPARSSSGIRLSMLGEELNVLSFTEKTETGVVSYSSVNGGESWTKKTLESAASSDKPGFSSLLKLAEGFEKTGTETVRGSEATVYAGVIGGDQLGTVLGMSDTFSNVFSAMNMPVDEADFSAYGDVPVTVAIDDQNHMVTRYTMDLTELMSALMPAMLKAVLTEAAAESGLKNFDINSLGFSVETGRVFASVELYDFDAVGEIEIPAAALAAPEAAA